MRRVTIVTVLLILLFFTSPFTAETSALTGRTPLRPEWIKSGDYVTYLSSVTTQGLTGTIHMRVTIQDDSGIYLNHMRIERFGPHIPPNFPSGFGLLDPQFAENTTDQNFRTTEEQVTTYKPEIELVRGLNNKTYETYPLTFHQIYDLGDPCTDCNLIVWYERETLIKVKQLQWYEVNGMNVTSEQLIEESNIPQLASPSQSTELAKTVTTTIIVRHPQTTVTTTVVMTTTVTGQQIVETTTLTESFTNISTETTEPTIYVWAIGATIAAIILPVILIIRKKS